MPATTTAPQKLELPELDLGEMKLQSMPGLGIEGLDEARHAELVDALGEDVFQELVESFFNDATSLIQDLHVALANHDPEKIDRALHTIKGAAAGIGAFGLAQLARTAEEDVRSGSGLSPERVADLGMAVQEVSGFVAQMLPDEAD